MARVATDSIFPGIAIDGDMVTIPLAVFGSLPPEQIAGTTSDVRAFSYAIDIAIADGLAALPAEQRPTGFTKTVGTVSNAERGKQTIPVSTSYTTKNDLRNQVLVDEV